MPRGWWGAFPGGGGLPPLRGASGVRRCPSPSRLPSGAGSRPSGTRVSRVNSVRAWGPSTGPTACALAGRCCSLWGWRKGVPGGGAFHCCEGRLRSGAPPPPTAPPLGGLFGSATHVLWARVCGCGGATLSPWPACPVGAACRGGGGGPSPGVVACHRCEGCLVSGAIPPPAARPLGRAAGVPRPVCPGCGRCGCGDPAPAPRRAPLRAGVARPGGGGRASLGGGDVRRCEGCLGSGALPPPAARPLGGLPGPTTHWLWVRGDAGVGTRHQPHSARSCALWGRHEGARGGRLLPACEASGVGALPPPTARPLRGLPGTTTHWLGVRGVRAWGPFTNPTARALASWLCALWGRQEGAREGRLLPACGASGVRRSPSPDCPPSGRAAGARYPLAVGAGGCGRGDPPTTPQRALLRAVEAA